MIGAAAGFDRRGGKGALGWDISLLST